jgi:hypothetical protein
VQPLGGNKSEVWYRRSKKIDDQRKMMIGAKDGEGMELRMMNSAGAGAVQPLQGAGAVQVPGNLCFCQELNIQT